MTNLERRLHGLELRRLLLNEAVGCDVSADEFAEAAVKDPTCIFGPSLRKMAHNQRIRAMELRGQAAALAVGPSDAFEHRS